MIWYPGFGSYWDDNMENEKDDPKWIEDYLKALEELKFQDRHGRMVISKNWHNIQDKEYTNLRRRLFQMHQWYDALEKISL